jgi:succinate dehydrogenase hydrophobic anchor subunit
MRFLFVCIHYRCPARALSVVDSSTDALKVFHWTGILLAVHVPIAFCGFMPPMIQSIMDDSLSVLFPLHGFIGVNTVISDYVPGKLTAPARVLAFVSALVSMAGLYKLGMGDGPGLSQTVKNLWVKPKKE